MNRYILYGKIGRSMPLTVEGSGTLGGDIEMSAVITTLANRHPDDTFVLIGRNSGEDPRSIGMPDNIINPWTSIKPNLLKEMKQLGLTKGPLTSAQQLEYDKLLRKYTGSWFGIADSIIMWAGQHGTSNTPIPRIDDRTILTKPQDAFAHYAGFLLRGINQWRDENPWHREEIWLNADPRNYLKMRDLKWPLQHPVLTQYDFVHNIKHERYGDATDWHEFSSYDLCALQQPDDIDRVWCSGVENIYARLELNALVPGTPSGDMITFDSHFAGRAPFGVVINEARTVGVRHELRRLTAMHDWIMPVRPTFIHGTWSRDSMVDLRNTWNIDMITPLPWTKYNDKMHTVLSTFTTPSSGSGWATTKPWESFAAGVVCFFHPAYDTQDNILMDAPEKLRDFLRVQTPEQLRHRIHELTVSEPLWREMIHAQREHFDRAMNDLTYVKMIEQRIYGAPKEIM